MKFFAAIVVVAIVAGVQSLTDEQKEKVRKYHAECLEVSHADKALIEKARKGEFTDDAAFKAHLFCFSKKAGFQNEAGEIQRDVIKAKLQAEVNDEAATEKLLAACLPAGAVTNPQQTAFDVVKCYYEKTPNHVSLA